MTEKVKLTREQADAIEYYRTESLYYNDEKVIQEHISKGEWLGEMEGLNGVPLLTLVDALRIGYDVGPEYKVGDWVARLDGDPFNTKHLAAKVAVVHPTRLELEGQFGSFSYDFIDHATPEEIKVEQERRVWADHGREVGEFRDGDFGEHVSGREQSESQEYLSDWYKRGRLKGFYPAESFISFEEVDSNA